MVPSAPLNPEPTCLSELWQGSDGPMLTSEPGLQPRPTSGHLSANAALPPQPVMCPQTRGQDAPKSEPTSTAAAAALPLQSSPAPPRTHVWKGQCERSRDFCELSQVVNVCPHPHVWMRWHVQMGPECFRTPSIGMGRGPATLLPSAGTWYCHTLEGLSRTPPSSPLTTR